MPALPFLSTEVYDLPSAPSESDWCLSQTPPPPPQPPWECWEIAPAVSTSNACEFQIMFHSQIAVGTEPGWKAGEGLAPTESIGEEGDSEESVVKMSRPRKLFDISHVKAQVCTPHHYPDSSGETTLTLQWWFIMSLYLTTTIWLLLWPYIRSEHVKWTKLADTYSLQFIID